MMAVVEILVQITDNLIELFHKQLIILLQLLVVVMVDMLIEYKEYLLVLNQDIHQQVLNLLE
jgi:hypothetical protein